MSSSEIELATFQLAAYSLNQLCYLAFLSLSYFYVKEVNDLSNTTGASVKDLPFQLDFL
jgi:hypothetical protein